ncbi:conserved hypothetical protein, partial [Ricinus communis]
MALAMPVISTRWPSRMNSGTASRISEDMPSSKRPATTASGLVVTVSMKATVARPKQKAMGMPSSTDTASTRPKNTTRFQFPMACSQAAPRYIAPATAASRASTPTRSTSFWREMRSSERAIISAAPTATAAARTVLGQPRAGVCTNISSSAYSHIGCIRISSITHGAMMARASAHALPRSLMKPTSTVVRMCVPRRRATAAPRLASQRKRMEASSSAQGMGLLKMKRMITPASSTATSPTTSAAAGISMARPSQCSRRAASERSSATGCSSDRALIPGSLRCSATASRRHRRIWRA